MLAPHLPTAALASTLLAPWLSATPQGPGTPPVGSAGLDDPRYSFHYPLAADDAAAVPFVDPQGQPAPRRFAAVGSGDFDGDRNPETWYLADDGSLAVLMAQTADVGRYVPYLRTPAGSAAFTSAATWGRAGDDAALLLVDPTQPAIYCLDYLVSPGQGPRGGDFVLQPTTWTLGTGMVAIATADPDGDGDTDAVVLREIRDSQNQLLAIHVDCLVFGRDPLAGLTVLRTWSTTLVLPTGLGEPHQLRAGDLDGDGRTDWTLTIPGLGVVGFAEGLPAGVGVVRSFVALDAIPIADVDLVDLDGDGADEIVTTLDAGLLVSPGTGYAVPFLHALPRPAGVGPLTAAAAVDTDGDGHRDLVGIAADGQDLALSPWLPATLSFGNSRWLDAPAGAATSAGTGPVGVCDHLADLDSDGDLDLLMQTASADRFLVLRSPESAFSPLSASIQPIAPQAPSGFRRHELTVTVPPELLAAGVTDLEVAIFLDNRRTPTSGDFEYWTRVVVAIDPQTRSVTVPIEVMLDLLNEDWIRNTPIESIFGAMTAVGETIVSIHPKSGTRRYESVSIQWDDQGPHGSAVGVQWRIVAAPPLPKADADLLPWD